MFIGFLILTLISIIIICYLSDEGLLGWSTLTVGVWIAALWFMLNRYEDINLIDLVVQNPVKTGLLMVPYFLIGFCWSMFKLYIEVKRNFNPLYYKHDENGKRQINWKVFQEYKPLIKAWICFWPYSVINWVWISMFYDIATWVFNQFQATYRKIFEMAINSMFKQMQKEKETNAERD